MDERMDFQTYERDWLKRHKGSIVRPPRISSWALIGGIFIWAVIALGAAVVSGAHSVPAILQTIPQIIVSPFREILSLFGFTIFELLIFAGALYRKQTGFATMGLLLSLVGALAANIGSSVFSVHENNGGGLDYAVAVILALIAPLAAFLAGEMVQRLFSQHHEQIALKNAEYDDRRRELDKVINREFTKYEKAFIPVHSVNSVNALPPAPIHSVNSVNGANGYTKQMNSRQIISEYFGNHPEFTNMTLDQLNEAIERESGVRVGRTSIHNVRKTWSHNDKGMIQ